MTQADLPTSNQQRTLYGELARRLEQGQPVAVATIVRAWGSTPREVGARMLVDRGGSILGTVGGGCGEAEVWEEAQNLFGAPGARVVHVDLTEDPDSDSGKVCGGRFDVLVELWRPETAQTTALARSIARSSCCGDGLVVASLLGPTATPEWKRSGGARPESRLPLGLRLVFRVESGLEGSLGTPSADAALEQAARQALREQRDQVVSLCLEGVHHDLYLEVLAAPSELVIAGAGHIARPLCAMAALCGYSVVVIDDRSEYADAARFPGAHRVVCQPFEPFFEGLSVSGNSHVVLVTRGHRHDQDCLRQLVGRDLAYVGMIGSRRRIRAVFDELLAEGVDGAWLERVHAPIGLDIGAQSPEEIAVCILAEMVMIRRGGSGRSLKLSLLHGRD